MCYSGRVSPAFSHLSVVSGAAEMDSQEIKELQQEVMEELGISMEELQDIIDKELEKFECVKQRKQQLEELEKCVKQKEEEVARVDRLFDDASRWAHLESQPRVSVGPRGRGEGDHSMSAAHFPSM